VPHGDGVITRALERLAQDIDPKLRAGAGDVHWEVGGDRGVAQCCQAGDDVVPTPTAMGSAMDQYVGGHGDLSVE
jgi:hypothetical protein